MAYHHPQVAAGYVAESDLSSSQYLLVKMGTEDSKVVLCGDGEDAVGVLVEPAVADGAVTVAVGGQVKVVAGGTFSRGAKLASDASGKVVTAISTDVVVGTAVTSAGAADEVVTMEFDKEGVLA